MRINEQAEINSYYLSALFGSRYGKAYFLKSAKQTTGIASINSTQLKNFPTVIPPIDLQNKFSTIAKKIERIKFQYKKNHTDMETLYGALSQRAFNGELDLSRVPLLAEATEGEQTMAIATLPAQASAPAINLPETDLLLPALEDRKLLKNLLCEWLEFYRATLGDTIFSMERFMNAAQIRIAELHPDNDFELEQADYDHVKAWVFDALATGKISQTFCEVQNRIQLKAVQA